MTTRRTFLGAVAAGAAAATGLRGRALAAGPSKPPLALQLYSLRAQLEKDVPGTLARVRGWGFDEVETYGAFGAEIAPQLKAAGLGVCAMHIGWDRLRQDMPGVLRDADAVGAGTIINPNLPHAAPYATREEILAAAALFRGWSKACRAAGKRFAYHTHGQEFAPAPEGTLFDVLMRESGADVGIELDVYWAAFGGGDPVAVMKAHPGRVWFTHLKDMARGTAPLSPDAHRDEAKVVLGRGQLDIKGIVAAGPAAGVERHVIEDESADPAGQIPTSVAYYRAL